MLAIGRATARQEVAALDRQTANQDVTGILLTLPLPEGVDLDTVLAHLPAAKDVEGITRLGFDDAHLSVKAHARLGELLPAVELVPASGIVEGVRAVAGCPERAADQLGALERVLGGTVEPLAETGSLVAVPSRDAAEEPGALLARLPSHAALGSHAKGAAAGSLRALH